MTLRVTSYNGLQPLYPEDDEQLNALRSELLVGKSPTLVALAKHPAFPERADYWPSGFFRLNGDPPLAKAFSDGDYLAFKDWLAKTFAGRSIAAIFEDPQPAPFMELIYFNEKGQHYMIGPKTAEKLAQDFAANDGQAASMGGALYNIYVGMHALFKGAAKTGAVAFAQ